MTALILDTNSLRMLAEEEKVQTIIDTCDTVYVPRCVRYKEFNSVYARTLQLRYSINRVMEELNGIKFHVINPQKPLRNDLEKVLIQKGASKCDRDVVKLALERKVMENDVVIITKNAEHFQKIHKLRKHCRIIFPEDYPSNN